MGGVIAFACQLLRLITEEEQQEEAEKEEAHTRYDTRRSEAKRYVNPKLTLDYDYDCVYCVYIVCSVQFHTP